MGPIVNLHPMKELRLPRVERWGQPTSRGSDGEGRRLDGALVTSNTKPDVRIGMSVGSIPKGPTTTAEATAASARRVTRAQSARVYAFTDERPRYTSCDLARLLRLAETKILAGGTKLQE